MITAFATVMAAWRRLLCAVSAHRLNIEVRAEVAGRSSCDVARGGTFQLLLITVCYIRQSLSSRPLYEHEINPKKQFIVLTSWISIWAGSTPLSLS